jgi:hypothetical protein
MIARSFFICLRVAAQRPDSRVESTSKRKRAEGTWITVGWV